MTEPAKRFPAGSEEFKRIFVDSALDAIITIDSSGAVVDFNPAAEKIFGYSRPDILGRNLAETIIPPNLREQHRAGLQRYLETGEHSLLRRRIEITAIRANGEEFPVELTITPYTTEGETFFTGFLRDISERKNAEKQMQHALKLEVVGQLTGGVAHDFNNMLGVIIGNLDLIKDKLGETDSLRPFVQSATTAALRGAKLNRQLLAFSRQQTLSPEIFDLNANVTNMLAILRRTLGETIEIDARQSGDLWSAEADPTQVDTALLNLALNARDAMPDGGTLSIATENVTLDEEYAVSQVEVEPGDYVVLAVSDTGIGMPPKVRDRAFEPFFTTKGVGQGSGLGLSMVFGFAKQSGGHVTINSEPGEGTTIRMYLPRAPSVAAATPVKEAALPDARGETVLVVEDDRNLRTLVVATLRDLGYDALDADRGSSALEQMARAPQIHLLLTDVVLPGKFSGPGLAVEAAKRLPDIKVLYMTGYPRNAFAGQNQLDEDVLLLEKPFRKVEFARKVREALASGA